MAGIPRPAARDRPSADLRPCSAADRSIIGSNVTVQDNGEVLSFQSEPQFAPRLDLCFTSVRVLGSRNWHTCASKTRIAHDLKGAQRDPLLKPFLTPVSPSGNKLAQKALLPLGVVIGVARVLVVVVVGLLYFLIDSVLSALLVSSQSSALSGGELTSFNLPGCTTHTNRETPLCHRVCTFDPLRAWVLVDTCRGCQ